MLKHDYSDSYLIYRFSVSFFVYGIVEALAFINSDQSQLLWSMNRWIVYAFLVFVMFWNIVTMLNLDIVQKIGIMFILQIVEDFGHIIGKWIILGKIEFWYPLKTYFQLQPIYGIPFFYYIDIFLAGFCFIFFSFRNVNQ